MISGFLSPKKRTVKHMNTKTIIAPSAAGKSTFCKKNHWVTDGDKWSPIALMYKRLGDKYGPRWWTGDGAAERLAVKDRWFAGLRVKVASSGIWLATAELELASHSSVFVIPDPATLVEHSRRRNNEFQPIFSHEEAERHVIKYADRARKLRCLVFRSFDDLVCVPGSVFTVGGGK